MKARIEQIEREAKATLERPLWKLPDSWWDEDAAQRMADWIKRNRVSS